MSSWMKHQEGQLSLSQNLSLLFLYCLKNKNVNYLEIVFFKSKNLWNICVKQQIMARLSVWTTTTPRGKHAHNQEFKLSNTHLVLSLLSLLFINCLKTRIVKILRFRRPEALALTLYYFFQETILEKNIRKTNFFID